MFLPSVFKVDDRARIVALLRAYPFGMLVTMDGEGPPLVTHIPMLLDPEEGPQGMLYGHMARANPHWRAFDGREALAVFTGPHGYVSPSWYGEHPAVPTWNYATVHAAGVPHPIDDEAETWELLQRTVATFEDGREAPWRMNLPEDYRRKMVAGVVAFCMPVERIEAKFKLSQNRPAADVPRVIAALRESGDPESRRLGDFMLAFYETAPEAGAGQS